MIKKKEKLKGEIVRKDGVYVFIVEKPKYARARPEAFKPYDDR